MRLSGLCILLDVQTHLGNESEKIVRGTAAICVLCSYSNFVTHRTKEGSLRSTSKASNNLKEACG